MIANKHLIKRIFALALCLCLLLTLTGCTTGSKYQSANKLLAEGKYAEAAEKFEALGSFEDAPLLTMYAKAAAAGEAGQFEVCLQTFENLGDFKDSPMMTMYYKARRNQASGLTADPPEQQAANKRWNDLMGAAGFYGQQLLFRDSQQRQLDCYQAVYDMAEGLAAAELFDAASQAHECLAFVLYLDSGDLDDYYAARSLEAAAPKGIAYEDRWAAEDFEAYQNAILVYDQYPHVRDSQIRAEACRQTLYTFAMECAAHEDYTNAAAIIGYATGHPDEDKLSAYWGACYLEQTERYELAAKRFEIYADFAPEGGETGTVRAEAARQKGYDAAMALLEEGKYEDGYELLRSLGDFGGATAYIPRHEFQRAQTHLDAGEYEDAIDLFERIGATAADGAEPGYTPELGEAALLKMQESFYRYGEELFAAAQTEEDYEEARRVFFDAGDYTPEGGVPAKDRYHSLWYEKGEALMAQEELDRESAKDVFQNAGDYAPEGKPSGTERYNAMWYEDGERLFAEALTEADYANARDAFSKIIGYTPEGGIPAADRYASLWYEKGEALMAQEEPDYDGAYAAFLEAAGEAYTPEGCADGLTRAKEAMYLKGEALMAQETPDYDGAREAFGKAEDYAPEGGVDAATRVKECWYRIGEALLAQDAPNYHAAKNAFEAAGQSVVAQKLSVICEQLGSVIDASGTHTVALCRDSTVVATGRNESGECNVTAWTDIIAVAVGKEFTVGLKRDGTVMAVGNNDRGQCDVESWTDIIAISAGAHYTVGLREDGTVVAAGGYYKGLNNVTEWTDIVAVAAGSNHTVGLKEDGTVVAVGYNGEGQCETGGWKDIAMIAADATQTIGLKQDGTVVAAGYGNNGQCETKDWSDIVAVDSGSFHTLGLHADGTVVARGFNGEEQCAVSAFSDIVAVAGGGWTTIGLKADGAVVATGLNDCGQCDVAAWENIGLNTSCVEKILSEIE